VLDAGGSTAEARWFAPEGLEDLRLTEVTVEALRSARLPAAGHEPSAAGR
jgi:hypothetical protein